MRQKRPASVVIVSATYLLSISSPEFDNVAMCLYDIILLKLSVIACKADADWLYSFRVLPARVPQKDLNSLERRILHTSVQCMYVTFESWSNLQIVQVHLWNAKQAERIQAATISVNSYAHSYVVLFRTTCLQCKQKPTPKWYSRTYVATNAYGLLTGTTMH